MAASPVTVKIEGLPELRAALLSLPEKLRRRALRDALAAGARVVQRAARAATPVISASARAVQKGYRKPGTVRQAIRVRTSKISTRQGNVGVFVNVKPAPGAKFRTKTSNFLGLKVKKRTQVRASQRGAKSPNDPYYWRFINFGTATGTPAARFVEKGAAALPAALPEIVKRLGPAIQKLNVKKAA